MAEQTERERAWKAFLISHNRFHLSNQADCFKAGWEAGYHYALNLKADAADDRPSETRPEAT